MKKVLITICLVLLGFSICEGSSTTKSKWESFRDLEWGTNIEDMNDPNMILMHTSEDKSHKVYIRKTDKLFIGRAELEHIWYMCYKGKFYAVNIRTRDASNGDYLKAAVFAYYGKGMQPNQFIEEWNWPPYRTDGKILMFLKSEMFTEKTSFTISYVPIVKQRIEDDKKAAKDAEDDF